MYIPSSFKDSDTSLFRDSKSPGQAKPSDFKLSYTRKVVRCKIQQRTSQVLAWTVGAQNGMFIRHDIQFESF